MKIPDCHPDRPYLAKGFCAQCYARDYDANRRPKRERKSYYVRKDPSEFAANFRQPPRKPARVPDCHPDRPHCAMGLCRACWQRARRIAGPGHATCHPDRVLFSRGMCEQCYRAARYWDDPDKYRQAARESQAEGRKRLRDALVAAYGGRCACRNCPETNTAFLCLDHVNGDGRAHRLKMGSHTYEDLRRQGWPQEGYRLLCWNCNGMTRGGRICPHEQESI